MPNDLTRRQLLAGAMGAAGLVISSSVVGKSILPILQREDLIPGVGPRIDLARHAWNDSEDHLSFAAIGDNGSGGRQAFAVATQMAQAYRQQPFGLVSMLGDICYYGSIDERFVDVFVEPLGPLVDAGVGFELAVGNHDGALFLAEPRLHEIEARLDLLGTPGRYYTTTHGPVDFFYLDTSTSALFGPTADEQLTWLEEALAASTAPWRIVCTHHPPFSSGRHGVTPGLAGAVVPLFEKFDVDLVLSGHDHHYERVHPRNGVTYVVSGGGCKRSPVFGAPFTAFADSVLQFLIVEVTVNRLVGKCVVPDGTVIDRFELQRRR